MALTMLAMILALAMPAIAQDFDVDWGIEGSEYCFEAEAEEGDEEGEGEVCVPTTASFDEIINAIESALEEAEEDLNGEEDNGEEE